MCRFKDGDRIRDIGAGRDTDTAYLCSQCIGYVISVQIQGGQYAEFCRTQQDLLKECIGQYILDDNFFSGFRICEFAPWTFADDFRPEFPFCQCISPVTETAFRKFHDVALVNKGYRRTVVIDGVLDGFAHKPFRTFS